MSNMLAKQIRHGVYVQAFPDDRNIQRKEFQTICFILKVLVYILKKQNIFKTCLCLAVTFLKTGKKKSASRGTLVVYS